MPSNKEPRLGVIFLNLYSFVEMRRRPIHTCHLLYKPALTRTGEPKSEEDADVRGESAHEECREEK